MLVAIPTTSHDEQKLVLQVQTDVWKHLIDTTSFNDWLSCGDRWMVDKAVKHAWALFKAGVVEPEAVPA